MATYGIIADIHGNREALVTVVAFLEQRRVDRILCLGDIVGFNADSNQCIEVLRNHSIETIAGNHDLISIGRLGLEKCSNKAAFALKQTRKDLSAESKSFLGTLEQSRVYENKFLLVHGSINDIQQYMMSEQTLRQSAKLLEKSLPGLRLCFFAHTHAQKMHELIEGSVRECDIVSPVQLAQGRTYFINPGSIDASRKRRERLAEFGIYDSSRGRMEFHRLPYDHEAVEAKAFKNGYRIGRVTDWLYTFRRKIRGLAGVRHAGSTGRETGEGS